ncbi:MAG: S8 family serine peptidase, partial [Desulfobulbaceae bacterium]|nr:S8 family serine peptidase [Desulfobulbaceae bacterium]
MKRFISTTLLALIWAIILLAGDAATSMAAQQHGITNLSVKLVKDLTAEQQVAVIARNGGTEIKAIPALRLHIIAVPDQNLPLILQDYRNDPQVESVEIVRKRKAEGLSNDTHIGVQWALKKIGWDQVFGKTTPKFTARVALLDSGVDATHPDLKANVVAGTSILDGTNGLTDSSGHGTQMAGIVAAVTNNSKGVAGVAFKGVKIMPVTVLGADNLGEDNDIIAGIIWAVEHGADVILMGFSNPDYSQHLQDAIDY